MATDAPSPFAGTGEPPPPSLGARLVALARRHPLPAALAGVGVLVLALAATGALRAPPPASAPVRAVPVPSASAAAPTAAPTPSAPPAAHAPAATSAVPSAGGAAPLLTGGAAPELPVGAATQPGAREAFYADQTTRDGWSALDAARWVRTGTADAPPAAALSWPRLRQAGMLPRTRWVRVVREGLFEAPVAGEYTLAAEVQGDARETFSCAIAAIDPTLVLGRLGYDRPQAAGLIALAPGWHRLYLDCSASGSSSLAVRATVLAPGTDMPVPVTLAVPVAAAKAEPEMASE